MPSRSTSLPYWSPGNTWPCLKGHVRWLLAGYWSSAVTMVSEYGGNVKERYMRLTRQWCRDSGKPNRRGTGQAVCTCVCACVYVFWNDWGPEDLNDLKNDSTNLSSKSGDDSPVSPDCWAEFLKHTRPSVVRVPLVLACLFLVLWSTGFDLSTPTNPLHSEKSVKFKCKLW